MFDRPFLRGTLGAMSLLLFTALVSLAQDSKPPDKPPKRGQLPANWSKLGLSDEQKAKVYSIQAEFQAKTEALKKQLEDLQKQERRALEAVLTPAQKSRLREILLEKIPGGGGDSDKPDKPK